MRLGRFSVIQDEVLSLRHEIQIEGEAILAGCDLTSTAEPPLLLGPDAKLRIESCRLEGTFVEWFQTHHGVLEWERANWLGEPVNAGTP